MHGFTERIRFYKFTLRNGPPFLKSSRLSEGRRPPSRRLASRSKKARPVSHSVGRSHASPPVAKFRERRRSMTSPYAHSASPFWEAGRGVCHGCPSLFFLWKESQPRGISSSITGRREFHSPRSRSMLDSWSSDSHRPLTKFSLSGSGGAPRQGTRPLY